MYLSFYCKSSKGVTQGLRGKRSWRPNVTAIYWPPLLWLSALCLSRSPGLLNRRPRGPLCWVRAFSTASCYQRVSKHHRGSRGSLRPGVAFPTTSRPLLQLSDFFSWLSYIIVQCPLNRLLNLWNGMFDRHQAEITVMQLRGHSLPVHQSMSVLWDFLPCPVSSANFRLRDCFRLLAIGVCHFLPVHHFGMAYLAGSKVKIQHSQSMSSLWCKFLCIVNNFIILWSICISSFPFECLTKGAALVFIPLMRFLLQSLFFRSFLVCLTTLFSFFFHFGLLFTSICNFSFLQTFRFFLDLVFLFLLLFLFHFSLSAWHIFQCQIPFLYPGCMFLFSV